MSWPQENTDNARIPVKLTENSVNQRGIDATTNRSCRDIIRSIDCAFIFFPRSNGPVTVAIYLFNNDNSLGENKNKQCQRNSRLEIIGLKVLRTFLHPSLQTINKINK